MRARHSLPLILLLATLGSCGVSGAEEEARPVKRNRLQHERSPYLRQHETNPVDWYPWGAEALEKAKKEQRPIFLSIGYAACHWCHVMEHESFEHEQTAALLNRVFVCVKVDREERPDLDRIYMNAVQVMSGRGGWPMTVLLTPDGRPFWGGTYLPRQRLVQFVERVEETWKKEKQRVIQQAEALSERVQRISDGPDLPPVDGSDQELIQHMRAAMAAAFDQRHGGYGAAPKFPPHTELLYLLDDADSLSKSEQHQLVRTLEALDEGGIHDQMAGGFHRYSTDERWFLPHFEKMLYDNALLAQVFCGMYAHTKEERWRRVAHRLFGWLERDLKRPRGGYASSLDADTEGEEGLTYTWTEAEVTAVVGEEASGLIAKAFGFEAGGNFQDEATHRRTGRNHLYLPKSISTLAKERKTTVEALGARLDELLEALRVARDKRVQPGLDDKVITSWNGLLLSAFARAGTDLDEPKWHDRGRALATFLLERCRRSDGTLLRFPKDSGPEIVGFCEDHVHLMTGLLDLAAATGEDKWATAAVDLGGRLVERFQDDAAGGFWTTGDGYHEDLFTRSKESFDTPIPSDNGAAARACLRLFARTSEERFRDAADATLSAFRPSLGQPRMARMLLELFRALRLRGQLEAKGKVGARSADLLRRQDVLRAGAFLARRQVKAGGRLEVVVRVHLDKGWHIGTQEPGGGTTPTELVLQGAKGWTLGDVQFPEGQPFEAGWAKEGKIQVLEGQFEVRLTLTAPAEAPAGPYTVPLSLRYQPCNDQVCKDAARLELALKIRIDETAGALQHPSLFPPR